MRFGKYMGAAHSLEIPFAFNNLDRLPASLLFNKSNIDEAQELSNIMEGYWINFAHTGDPNGEGLPEWPVFEPGSHKVQVFDTIVRTERANMQERCEFWEGHPVERRSIK